MCEDCPILPFSQPQSHSSQQTLCVHRVPFNFSGSFRCSHLTVTFISGMCHVSCCLSLAQRPGCCWLAKGPMTTSHWGPRPEEEQHFEGQARGCACRRSSKQTAGYQHAPALPTSSHMLRPTPTLWPVLVSAGTELTLFLVAGTVLCFGFSVRIMLITRWCFSCC